MNHTNSIMRVVGLNSIERIEPLSIDVSKQHLDECLQWFSKAENARQLKQGKKKAIVLMTSKPPLWMAISAIGWAPIGSKLTTELRPALGFQMEPYSQRGKPCTRISF